MARGRKRGGNRGGRNNVEDRSGDSPSTNDAQFDHPGRNSNYTNHHGFSTGAFGVMGSESDDFIQRPESDGQPSESQQSDNVEQQHLRDSRTMSQLSIRSRSENQGQSDVPDLKQVVGGSRASSHSRMMSESNKQGEENWSNRDFQQNLQNSRTASQLSMRSTGDFNDGVQFNSCNDKHSLGGSRASSRSRMLSETDERPIEDYQNDRDIHQSLGNNRATSQLSIRSHRGFENGSQIIIPNDSQSFGGSRSSSRSRMYSETGVQPVENYQSDRDTDEYIGQNRVMSQRSMRSYSGLENKDEIIIPNDNQSFGGSRSSSRSRIHSETGVQPGEGYQSDKDSHEYLGHHSAMSQSSALENGGEIIIPNNKQTFGGSRKSSRSRLHSETGVQPGEGSDRDAHGYLGNNRARSQLSMHSHNDFENGEEINIPSLGEQSFEGSRVSSHSRLRSETDFQTAEGSPSQLNKHSFGGSGNHNSFIESRSSSRSRMLSDADRQHSDLDTENDYQQYKQKSLANSEISMRSNNGFEQKENEFDHCDDETSFSRSRPTSRSRMASINNYPTNEDYRLGRDDQEYLHNSRAASHLSINSNDGFKNRNQSNAPADTQSFKGSRSSSRKRMFSDDEQPNEDREIDGNAHQYLGENRAISQASIRSNGCIKNGSQLNIPNDEQSFGRSRESSRSRMLSEVDNQLDEDCQSDRDINQFSGNRSISHLSINSNGVDNRRRAYAPDDQQNAGGSHASSRINVLSEKYYQPDEERRSRADIHNYFGENRATSHLSINSKSGFDNGSHSGVPDYQPSFPESGASSRSRLPSSKSGQPDEYHQSRHDVHRFPGDARTMSQISMHSTSGFNNGSQFNCGDNIHSFTGSRSSSRSRLADSVANVSHSNRVYGDENYDHETHGFSGSRASSHISVRSISDDDEIMYAVLPKSVGEMSAINRNRFISMTSNASGGGYETDENLRLARINSGKETHLNLESNVGGSRLSMMSQSENPTTSRISMFNTDGTQHSVKSEASTFKPEHVTPSSVRVLSNSSAKQSGVMSSNEVPVPLVTTNAMTPCSIRNRLISDHGDSPAVCEKTRIEAIPENRHKVSAEMAVQTGETIRIRQDERQRNVFNNSFEKRGHPAAAVLSGMLQQRSTPPAGQSDRYIQGHSVNHASRKVEYARGSAAPATPKTSRSSAKNVSMGRVSLNESTQSHHGAISSYCQSDASTTDRFSDASCGSAYRWQVKEAKMNKSRSGLADAKWEQKKRDPGRTVRNNIKPGMILKLASVFDQQQVQSNKAVGLKRSMERKPQTDDRTGAFKHLAPMNAINERGDFRTSSYRDERTRNDDRKTAYNGIQDAYFDVSQDTDDSDFNAFVNSTPVNNREDNKYCMEDDYNSHEDANEEHSRRSSHLGNVKNMAAQFDKSNSMESEEHVRRSSNVASNNEKGLPHNEGYMYDAPEKLDSVGRSVRNSSCQQFKMEIGKDHGVSHTNKMFTTTGQVENERDVFRRSSAIGRQAHSDDIMEDHFNGHIDNLFGFVKDHDSHSTAAESVYPSFHKEEMNDRRGLARSVSKYRELQRSKRTNTADGPIKFTPASVPNAGQLAQNRSDFKKTLTIDNRIVALATSTPRESPHGTTKDFNANYDDSFLSSITDGSRGPEKEKYSDYRHQMNKLNHALDMTATQIAMTEKVLLQARKERKPLQELAAQRTLLVSNQRVKLLHKELKKLQELSTVRRLPPPLSKDVRGSMMISDIIVHLNPRFYNERNTDNNCSFAFVVLLKCGYEVEATSPVTIQSQSQFRLRQLHFFEKISFGNLPMSFEIQLEVYYMVIPGNKYDASCAANLANKCRNIFNPARKIDRNVDGLSVGEFSRCGYLLLTRDTSSKTTFYLDSAEYPLESTIEVRSRCSNLPPAIEVDFRGFLTMCQYVSGIGSWERYWAVLRRGCIYFWRYPDDESIQRDPRARLDLTNCIRETIVPCGAEQCPRPYSFSIDVLVSTTPSVMDRKRILLSADSAELMYSWLNAINETLNVIHC